VPGSVELENWVTFQTGKPETDRLSQFDFRHEFEFGITDRLQLSLYVADWRYESSGDSGFTYQGTAVEAIWNLSNPAGDPVGISLYEEVKVGDRLVESESKLIAQKNFGPLIVAYNFTLEATWEGDGLRETEGELQQAFGVSYELSPRFSVGLEMLHELVFPEWETRDSTQQFFIGPNVSFRKSQWFITATALAQATTVADESDFQVRTIVGYSF
jgi:hypothetical protein